ncbi:MULTISPECIES: hypothetical protein [unclassified Pseudoxanthomonas]|uniref:hypothetical protein n=1 Tax=unclassified Pseudoxanthomonas TaxID=2645906 RepID=UPI0008EE4D63|nr:MULTISPECIES: hypothetical protein [unclassified Pseudoxanthomonas]SFV33690.1 hypothetical protein SAMN05428990_2415 [Pseudoxanthomonas sp. YR558]
MVKVSRCRKEDDGPRWIVGLIALVVLTAGCQGMAMTQETRVSKTGESGVATTAWPLRFAQHNFGAHCFDTIGCRVTYAGFTHGVDRDDEVSPPMSSYKGSREQLLRAGHVGKRNFPPAAHLSWRSKDGVPHEADVDIGEIFKDRVVRHNVPREDYREDLGIADPDIVLEVNGRTVNVYMRALIPTKTEHLSASARRYSREDLILVSSSNY